MEPKYILLVDDDPDLTLANRLVLESAGYHVETASNGQEGLQKMRERKPDLVLMDVMMANPLEGYYITQQIGNTPGLRDVPILMVSSIAGTQYAENFPTNQYLNIVEFISKPIAPEDLLERVKRYVR